MSEDRFEQLEQKIDSLGQELRQEMRGLREEMHVEMRGVRDEMHVEMHGLRDEMHGFRDEMLGLHADLGHQMRVLHEDTIDKIKALGPDLEPIRREFRAADAKQFEDIDRRLRPLESEARARRRPRS